MQGELNLKANSASENITETAETDSINQLNIQANAFHTDLIRPTISTYNSFAAELASSYAMLIGEDPRARLITDAERWQIMNDIVINADIPLENAEILRESSIDVTVESALKLAAAIIDNDVAAADLKVYLQHEIDVVKELNAAGALNTKPFRGTEASKGFQVLKDGLPTMEFRLAILPYVEAYFAYKKENSLIEFADQISWATKILQTVPAVGKKLREQYKLVLLDEYQDTSVNQARFLAQAFKGVDSVCAVGDPNQAIYGWRGASANALADFIDFFEVAVQDQLTLYTSFRNPISVLNAANKITHGFKQEINLTELYEKFADLGESGRPWIDEPIIQTGKSGLKLPVLRPRTDAQLGKVIHVHRHLRQDSYTAMAAQIAADFAELSHSAAAGKTVKAPTGAVLIRTHSIAEEIGKALKTQNLEYEIVGEPR
ncbi:UvrD-helicase domain-containing protein [Arcanobacterium hippocoleae]